MTLETTRTLIQRQIARLERVIERGDSTEGTMALRLCKGLRERLRDLVTAPGAWRLYAREIGENGGTYSTFAVDDVCAGVEGRRFTRLVGGCVVDDERRVA